MYPLAATSWIKRACMPSHASKILRGVSGISGVSDRALSSILTWVKDNPEILEQQVGHNVLQSISGVDRSVCVCACVCVLGCVSAVSTAGVCVCVS